MSGYCTGLNIILCDQRDVSGIWLYNTAPILISIIRQDCGVLSLFYINTPFQEQNLLGTLGWVLVSISFIPNVCLTYHSYIPLISMYISLPLVPVLCVQHLIAPLRLYNEVL